MDEGKRHFTKLRVACPYCGAPAVGTVHATENPWWTYGEIKDGNEPYFGLPLYYRGGFDGKPIWAVNLEHLQYMIDYLEADLREKPAGAKMTQADHLPKFMKTAKNRAGMLKVLRRLQIR